MLKIFQSIFGCNERCGGHAESLIEMAIQRAIDGLTPGCIPWPSVSKICTMPGANASGFFLSPSTRLNYQRAPDSLPMPTDLLFSCTRLRELS